MRTQIPASEVAKTPLMFAWGKELTFDGCRVGVDAWVTWVITVLMRVSVEVLI